MKKLIIICSLLIIFYSCSDSKRIKEETFTELYTDLVIAQDTTYGGYEELNAIRNELYKKYNVTEAQYEETINYYNSDPRRWKIFFDKVLIRIENLQKEHTKE